MNTVVLKFGGTAIGGKENFAVCAKHVKEELKKNHKVICVVSAMGRDAPYSTDTLKGLINNNVTKKEQDRLISVGEIISSILFTDYLAENQIKAVALSTKEIGIITDNRYGDADIIRVEKSTLINKLASHDVLIVPGFQGLTVEGEVATLGRGGSDTTAIALGIAVKAIHVDIVSDVKGVFSADPRIIPEAIKIPLLNYDFLYDMTVNGSKVLHTKGAYLAKKYQMPLRFVAIGDMDSYSVVENTEIKAINLSYKTGYIKYTTNNKINDEAPDRYNNAYYIHGDDEWEFLKKSDIKDKKYLRKTGYSKITTITYDSEKKSDRIYVATNDVHRKLRELHKEIFRQG